MIVVGATIAAYDVFSIGSVNIFTAAFVFWCYCKFMYVDLNLWISDTECEPVECVEIDSDDIITIEAKRIQKIKERQVA